MYKIKKFFQTTRSQRSEGVRSSSLDMFYSNVCTFYFFRDFFFRFFFRSFFFDGEKIQIFLWKNLGRKKKIWKIFGEKKDPKFFSRTKIESIYFGVKHIQRRAPNSVWARRTISLKLLIILNQIVKEIDPTSSFKGLSHLLFPRLYKNYQSEDMIFWHEGVPE